MSVDEKRSLLPKQRKGRKPKYALVIHGGAGAILRERSSPELEARYRDALRVALQTGEAILSSGGEAMDAVVEAVTFMEGMQRRPY
jgi:L-asparaginase / beta-aspartyl-peptidase